MVRILKLALTACVVLLVIFGFMVNGANNPNIGVGTSISYITGNDVGEKAPEIALKTIDGTVLKLSSLRGKMVLIDFWASWCSPCRKENPNVVDAYNKYKDQAFVGGTGFTVYSISLDSNKDNWSGAIKADKLAWENHVCDYKKWQSPIVRDYSVTAIPSNYLIDGDGVIVATNLRGAALDKTLSSFLKK